MSELLGVLVLLAVALVVAVVILSAIVARQAVRPPRHTAGYAIAHGMAADPGELGLDYEEWILERPGRTRLGVWECSAKARSAEAARVTAVFVHGWGESRFDVLGRLEPWDALCGRLVLYDRRGHGDAEGGPGRLGCGEERDLLALIERLGDGPLLLVGRGMGAAIAVAAARAATPGGPIAGVVVEEPGPGFPEALRRRLRAEGYPARPLADLAILFLRLGGLRPPGRWAGDAAPPPVPLLLLEAAASPDSEQVLAFMRRVEAAAR